MQYRIMRGWPFTPEEQQRILDYCYGDVGTLPRLLTGMLPESTTLALRYITANSLPRRR